MAFSSIPFRSRTPPSDRPASYGSSGRRLSPARRSLDRRPRRSDRPGGPGAALRRAADNLDRAKQAHAGLDPKYKYDPKTVAATRRHATLSGWAHEGDDLPGITYVPPDKVQSLAGDMEFKLRGAGAADHGVPGQHFASHAEAQQHVVAPAQPIGVDRAMCPTCQKMFQHTANYSHQPLLVTDPKHTRLFLPGHDKPIVDPNAADFPAARPITPGDVHHGIQAGAGAAVAAPHGNP